MPCDGSCEPRQVCKLGGAEFANSKSDLEIQSAFANGLQYSQVVPEPIQSG